MCQFITLIVASLVLRTTAVPHVASNTVSYTDLVGHEIQRRVPVLEGLPKDNPSTHEVPTHDVDMEMQEQYLDPAVFSQIVNMQPSYEVEPTIDSGTSEAVEGESGIKTTGTAVIIELGKTLLIYGFGDRIWEHTITKDSTGEDIWSQAFEWKPYSALDFGPYDKRRADAYGGIDLWSRMDLAEKIGDGIRMLKAQATPKESAHWTIIHNQAQAARNVLEPGRESTGAREPELQVIPNFPFVPPPAKEPVTKMGITPTKPPPSPEILSSECIACLLDDSNDDFWLYLRKRNTMIDEIKNEEGSLLTNSKNGSITDHAAEFQLYLRAYQTAQANISNLLFPYFDSILDKTNNSLVYDMVWSVFSDLTGLGPAIIGPFSFGMHRLDWIEDQYFNSTLNDNSNSNTTDPIGQQMLATHYALIQIYSAVWKNATAIANQTGLLRDIATLSRYLVPQNSSIESSTWNSPQQGFDDSYFTTYNRTRP